MIYIRNNWILHQVKRNIRRFIFWVPIIFPYKLILLKYQLLREINLEKTFFFGYLEKKTVFGPTSPFI